MSVILTDEQLSIMLDSLMEIAHGAWYRNGARARQFSARDAIDRARRAAVQLGLDWAEVKPELRDHKANLTPTLDIIEQRARPRSNLSHSVSAGRSAGLRNHVGSTRLWRPDWANHEPLSD